MQLPADGQPHVAWGGIPGSSDQVLFANNDLNNTWSLGFRNNIATGGTNTIPVPPSGTVALSANRTVYAAAPSGTTALVVIPGGASYFQGVTQGQGQLVLPSVRSPNFVTGVSGWIIRKDGSVEFNNGTFRGTVNAGTIIASLIESAASGRRSTFDANGDIKTYNAFGAVLFWYSNSLNAQLWYADTGSATQGALVASVTAADNTDSFGNAFVNGSFTYRSFDSTHFVAIGFDTTGELSFRTTTSVAGPWTANGFISLFSTDADLHINSASSAFVVVGSLLLPVNGVSGTGHETWHDMRPLSGSFIGTIAGATPPQFRLTNDGGVEISGNVQLPAVAGNYNGVTFANLPGTYRPTINNENWPVTLNQEPAITTLFTPRCEIDTSGNLQLHQMPNSLTSTVVSIKGRFPRAVAGYITS